MRTKERREKRRVSAFSQDQKGLGGMQNVKPNSDQRGNRNEEAPNPLLNHPTRTRTYFTRCTDLGKDPWASGCDLRVDRQCSIP